MVYNVTIGQAVNFTAVFFSSDVLTWPSSATITVTYPTAANSLVLASCAIGMTAVSSTTFTATWASSVAAAGLSSYAASAPGNAAPSSGSGMLRLMP